VLRQRIIKQILEVHLSDTKQARRLQPDGTYERVMPQPGEAPLSSQDWLMENWRGID
jgi:polyphosphate kinase